MLDSPLIRHFAGYTAGAFLPGLSGPSRAPADEAIEIHNPATGEVIARLPSYARAETERMVSAAQRALEEPVSIVQRAAWLVAIADILIANRDELARIITLENGKPLAEAKGEVDYAAGFYRVAAADIDVLQPRTLPTRPKGLTWTVHARPAGVVGLITPRHVPWAMLAKKLSGALAAGAPAVIKPANETPLSVIAMFHLLHDLRLPAGMINLVFGDSSEIGKVMCEHPAVRVISFTGSTRVGQTLAIQAAPHFKRLALELGGNAPFLVFEDADVDLAVEQLLATKFRCSGQTCVSANRVFVHEAIFDAFSAKLVERVSALRVGAGTDPKSDVGPLISERAVVNVQRLVDDALARGAERATESRSPETPGSHFFPPTVLTGVADGMAILKEETFGPVVPLVRFSSEAEVIAAANDTEYGLAAYVFTGDEARGERVAEALHFGHVALNTGSGPTPEAPFGGVKHSGYGREGGHEGILEFVELQTVPRG
jgi:succinate-semialdehyde dehydrogenase/glutarate-semialdehyde dehydrogenase